MQTVAINGIAGRIGKFLAYELIGMDIKISDVNDMATTDQIVASLAGRDSVHGSLDWKIEKISDSEITINGQKVAVHHEADPSKLQLDRLAGIVEECTGRFTEYETASKHLKRSVEGVIISAPGKGAAVKTYVMGVNHSAYSPSDKVISNASCTTKAIALPLKVMLDVGFPIYACQMVTTHAATNTQRPLDFMSAYGVLDNILSAKTGAAVATSEVIQLLEGKIDGMAMRVPTRDGSFANIYLVTNYTTKDHLNATLRAASQNQTYCDRMQLFEGKEIGTPDIIGNNASAIIATAKTKVMPFEVGQQKLALVQLVSGYDNERGPAKDQALLTQYIMNRIQARK